MNASFLQLVDSAKQCTICKYDLPMGPRPVFQVNPNARILIAGQAPGIRVHESGVPFDDASGNRLRDWLGISPEQFYDSNLVAILPMGFCYPGTGKSGDLPPRPECAATWRNPFLEQMRCIKLTLIIGQHAQKWHLPNSGKNLTETVRNWKNYAPGVVPLPHPSPRNNIWLKKNPWFEETLLPSLKEQVLSAIDQD